MFNYGNELSSKLAVLLLFCAAPLCAGTLTVSSTNDSGAGSLRQAIADAAAGDTIDFSVAGTITLTSGNLLITKDLTISGPGASSLAISGNHSSWVLDTYGATVAISGLTIENALGGCCSGGGIVNGSRLTLTEVTVSGNATDFGGGIYSYGTLTLIDSTVFGNSARYGGGIFNFGGKVTLVNSAVSGNSAIYFGGGILSDGTLTLINSTVSGNSATNDGGGIYSSSGTLTLTNSTLFGNSANLGGGIYNDRTYNYGTLTVTNSTLAGNSAASGGGIYATGYGAITLGSTIVATSPSGGNCFLDGLAAAFFTSYGHNLSDDTTCAGGLTQPSDLNDIPAGLDPNGLQDHGGPTQTIALLDTSPALDAIPFCFPVFTDQRGIIRPQGAACDIGAFEKGSDSGPPPPTCDELTVHLETVTRTEPPYFQPQRFNLLQPGSQTDTYFGVWTNALLYLDSPIISPLVGNVYQEIGEWEFNAYTGIAQGMPFCTVGGLRSFDVWLGLRNSDDQGANFDVKAELWRLKDFRSDADVLLGTAERRCIKGLVRNPDMAKQVAIPFADSLPMQFFDGHLVLKLYTRIGTPRSTCAGHAGASGLRVYYNSTNRDSHLEADLDGPYCSYLAAGQVITVPCN